MTKTFIALAALMAALTAPAHAVVGDNAALKHTAMSKFNADDLALMQARVNQALAAANDGETLDWKNDKTKAYGSVTPLNRLTWNGLSCRRLRVVNVYGSLKGEGVYKFCEKPAGRWKLVGPDDSND